AVEGGGDAAQLARALLGERLVRLAAAEARGGARQGGERTRDVRGDEPGAAQGEDQQAGAPAQPLQAELELEALARQHHPVLVLVDEEADEKAFVLVARVGEARAVAGHLAHLLDHEVEERLVRHRLELLARGRREYPQALGLVQLDQELAPQEGIGAHQRGAGEVDGADGLLGELARARLALIEQVDLERRQDRSNDERRDQEKRSRKKAQMRRLILLRCRERTRSRSPRRSGCASGAKGPPRRSCAAARSARRWSGRTPRTRGRARAPSACRAKAAGAGAAPAP